MKQTIFITILMVSSIILTACAHDINVKDSLVLEDHQLPALSISGPLDVTGAPPQHLGMVEFCQAGGNTFSTDFAQFTSYAVASATDILNRNKITTSAGAEKKLVLSVTEATCEQEAADINFIAYGDITCADNAPRRFTGNQRIWTIHGIDFALSAAVLNATLAAFEDDAFIACLSAR
jgi:hypothetical protein